MFLQFQHFFNLLFIVALTWLSLEVKASTSVIQPYQCPEFSTRAGSGNPQAKQTAAKDASGKRPITEEDCWFEIARTIDAMRGQGRVLVVTDIDKTLLNNQQTIQEGVEDIIHWLRNTDNIDLIALTARRPERDGYTIAQLHHLNLDIKNPDDPDLLNLEQQQQFSSRKFKFSNNIVFTSNKERKAAALSKFYGLLSDNAYSQIVVIDDILETCLLIARNFRAPEQQSMTITHYTHSLKDRACSKHLFHYEPGHKVFRAVDPQAFERQAYVANTALMLVIVVFFMLNASSLSLF